MTTTYISSNIYTFSYKYYLEEFLDIFEILKLEIRLCTDLKILSIKVQSQTTALLERIGKQITGWEKASS